MPAKIVIVPTNLGSRSAKALADTLSEKLGYRVFRVTPDRVGKRKAFYFRTGTDKLTQFKTFKEAGVSCPGYTTDKAVAAGWFDEDKHAVVCRTLLRGSEGRGIVLADNKEQLVDAPLYTKYIPKKREFRVHVLNGTVLDVQEKRKKKDFDDSDRDTRIRNVANGYVFCREDIEEPDGLRKLALDAVDALGYTLGAVDIGYNEHHKLLFVLEVNSTPGMEGTTLEKYSDAIIDWAK